jgi:hypothetical protein
VFAGRGDDTVVHRESDNLGSHDWYFGGKGQDTLRLVVSQATLDSAVFQQELAAFQAMIDAGRPATGYFSTLNIHFSQFEAIEIVFDNAAPDSISLSNASVAENDSGAVIGTLSATDPNGGAGLTFSLVGDSQSYYEIVDGTTLKLLDDISFDYEGDAVIPPAVVQVTDPGGLTYTQEFNIEVVDVNEAPTAITPTAFSNRDNYYGPGAIVGPVAVVDPDGDSVFDFNLSDPRFEITEGNLKLKDGESLDVEAVGGLQFDITATDPGALSYTQQVSILIEITPDFIL